jgi:hypothetical protein
MILLDFLRRYWFYSLPVFFVSGMLFINKKEKEKVIVDKPITVIKSDTLLVKVDSIVKQIENQKQESVKKISALEKEKLRLQSEASQEKKKRIQNEKDLKKKPKVIVETKEVVKEKTVYLKDPNIKQTLEESYKVQEENCKLKEELESTKKMNRRLKSEWEKSQKVKKNPDTMIVDTIRKKRKFLGIF